MEKPSGLMDMSSAELTIWGTKLFCGGDLLGCVKHELNIEMRTCCMQGQVVCRGKLYAGASCMQGQVVCRGKLYAGTSCMQGQVVCRGKL